MQVTLGKGIRKLHPEDFNEATYKKLHETVAGKQEVCFINGNGTREYGYVSSYSNAGNVFVKFSHTLLGFLYTDDAWEATTAILCGGLQLEFINSDTHE